MPELVIKVIPLWLPWKSNSPAVYYSLQVCMPAGITLSMCNLSVSQGFVVGVSVQNFNILSLWLPSFLYLVQELISLYRMGIINSPASSSNKAVDLSLHSLFCYNLESGF